MRLLTIPKDICDDREIRDQKIISTFVHGSFTHIKAKNHMTSYIFEVDVIYESSLAEPNCRSTWLLLGKRYGEGGRLK